LDSDSPALRPFSGKDLALLRHDSLRLAAPAVQHEVNNAMMVLASNLEMLARTAVEGPPRRQLDRAVEAMRKLDATVRGYLDTARRDAEDPGLVEPDAALAQVLPVLRVVLGGRFGFDLDPMPGGKLPAVRIDRGRLDLALLRLVQDAAQRMAAGARIVARGELRAATGEAGLLLRLPQGAEPGAEVARLLAEAVEATGGRLDRSEGRLVLAWPRAASAPV
jgi:hypothetical protein